MVNNEGLCVNCPLREAYTTHTGGTEALAYGTDGTEEWLAVSGITKYRDEICAEISLESNIGRALFTNAEQCMGPTLKTRKERSGIRRESEICGMKVTPDSNCPALNQVPRDIIRQEINAIDACADGWQQYPFCNCDESL